MYEQFRNSPEKNVGILDSLIDEDLCQKIITSQYKIISLMKVIGAFRNNKANRDKKTCKDECGNKTLENNSQAALLHTTFIVLYRGA